jgi:hypothetical protein
VAVNDGRRLRCERDTVEEEDAEKGMLLPINEQADYVLDGSEK